MSAATNCYGTESGWWSHYDRPRAASAGTVKIGGWSEWQIAAAKTILGFQSLSDNWDSYGSPRISREVMNFAMGFINYVFLENSPAPTVLPVSGGGIQFEWSKGDREVELEIRPDLSITYLMSEHGEPIEESALGTPSRAGHLFYWLNGG